MADIIDRLKEDDFWKEFYEYKTSKGYVRKSDRDDLLSFIDNREYIPVINRIEDNLNLSYPKMSFISKSGSDRKRVVFTFEREENYVLKGMTYLLKKYDSFFTDNLYSFRNSTGVKKAISRVVSSRVHINTYSYKADIHDYFNSVDVEKVIAKIEELFVDETRVKNLLINLLRNEYVLSDGEVVKARKGIMAGVPFSGFLANLYLTEMDRWFYERNISYLRYSDDVICFAKNKSEIEKYEAIIKTFISDKKLEINPKKEIRTKPGQEIEFLGFIFDNNKINVSEMSVVKIKAKLKRKTRALYRWRLKKELDGSKAAKAFIKYINKKFYQNPVKGEITWCRWYFPVINTPESLEVIDEYIISCIRYLYTGKYSKKNYNLRYEEIKKIGYKSLVNNYWKYKKNNEENCDEKLKK